MEKRRPPSPGNGDRPTALDPVLQEDGSRAATDKRGLAFRAARGIGRFHSVTALLDALIILHEPLASRWVRNVRQKNPGATPQQAVEALNGYLKGAVTAGGMGVAAGFAAPGIAKASVLALGVGQVLTVTEATALYTSARAAVYGIDRREPHRQLLLAGLLRKTSLADTVVVSEARLRHLLPTLATAVPAIELTRSTRGRAKVLTGRRLINRLPKGLAKGMPFITGAAVGGKISAEVAEQIIGRMDQLFGPPPPAWPEQVDSPSSGAQELESEHDLGSQDFPNQSAP